MEGEKKSEKEKKNEIRKQWREEKHEQNVSKGRN